MARTAPRVGQVAKTVLRTGTPLLSPFALLMLAASSAWAMGSRPLASPVPPGVTVFETVLHAVDGTTIFADWYTGTPTRQAALIVVPGYIMHKDDPDFAAMSRDLSRDFDVLCLSLRGHGKSPGIFTFGAKEWMDVAAGIIEGRRAHRRIFLLGFSLGAGASLKASSGTHGPDGMVLVSVPASYGRIWKRPGIILTVFSWYPGSGNLFGVRQLNPLTAEAEFIGTAHALESPVLFIHGDTDRLVPISHARAVFEVTGSERREFAVIRRGGHAEVLYREDRDEFLGLVRRWLASCGS